MANPGALDRCASSAFSYVGFSGGGGPFCFVQELVSIPTADMFLVEISPIFSIFPALSLPPFLPLFITGCPCSKAGCLKGILRFCGDAWDWDLEE